MGKETKAVVDAVPGPTGAGDLEDLPITAAVGLRQFQPPSIIGNRLLSFLIHLLVPGLLVQALLLDCLQFNSTRLRLPPFHI
jgi:hypothetical protein